MKVSSSKSSKSIAPQSECELSDQEVALLSRQMERKKVPRMKVIGEGEDAYLSVDHANKVVGHALLMEAMGSADEAFVGGLLRQLDFASRRNGCKDVKELDFMLSVIKDIQPKDEIESMLAAHMAVIHTMIMRYAVRLEKAELLPQQDSAERALNKLARTFAIQTETLKRYRTGGEQKVTVQHVSVQDGGQAIVGNVTQSSRQRGSQQAAVSRPALTDAKAAPMPIINGTEHRVRVPAKRRDNSRDNK